MSLRNDWVILKKVINTINESIMICDHQGNLILYNDACQRQECMLREQVIGRNVTNVYKLTEDTSQMLQAIKLRKPLLDVHFNYTTFTGRNFNTICSTYPLFENDKVVGAVSVTRECSKIKELSDKIIDLQEVLYKKTRQSVSVKSNHSTKYTFKDIIGQEKSFTQMINSARKVAMIDFPILIYGETGTGKELLAQSIHNASNRHRHPFIAINCAAIPENLLEGLLFGTVKGAFTEAIDRPGLFEQANGGTLLLDEINSMSIGLQAKLLRVLQENIIRRVGATNDIYIDVRVITNINVEPFIAIQKQLLRSDLYYRLGVVYIKIPPLRHHREDISLLLKEFINKNNFKLMKNVLGISPDVMDIFMKYEWPGNIRELQHCIESAMVMIRQDETIIQPEHLPIHICQNLNIEQQKDEDDFQQKQPSIHIDKNKDTDAQRKEFFNIAFEKGLLSDRIEEVEKQIILLELEKNHWNISRTSKQLGLKRQSLQYRMKKYNIKLECPV